MKTYKEIPEFHSELEEYEFWIKEDSTDYIDWSKSRQASFPNLKKRQKM